MNLKYLWLGVVAVSIGLAAWSLEQRSNAQAEVLAVMYLNAAQSSKVELKLLSELHGGHVENAKRLLEELLAVRENRLASCKEDLCAKAVPKYVSEAQKALAEYRERHKPK